MFPENSGYFLVLILILLIPLTSAIQFSPTSLEFNLKKNEGACKTIEFNIESSATVRDIWAQDYSDTWSISNFQTSSLDHKLNINYQPQISSDQKQIQVCLSGSKPGNYKGAIIFRQGEIGNSIIQFAVWLKVNVKGEIEQEEKPRSSRSSSSKSGDSSGIVWTSQSAAPPKKNIQEISYKIPQEEIKLNKPAKTKENQIPTDKFLAIVFSAVMIIVLLAILLTKRNNK